MRVLLLILLQIPQLPLLPLEPARPSQPASIDGIVIDSETRQPLAGATVLAQDRGGYGGKMITVTGNDGRFVFRNIPPGGYTIEASRSGYVSELIGTPLGGTPGNNPSPLVIPVIPLVQQVNPGQVLSGLRLVLTPGGVVTGRLIDERGEPVVGAILQALKVTHRDGLRERTPVQSAVSNDLGEYRFFMLKPGQYYIAFFPPTAALNFTIPLFYPGTIDVKESQTLDLHVGETIERVDFSSVPTKNRRITGGVEGNGSDGVSVVLSPANGTAKKVFTITRDDPPNFQFSDVVPGTYTLVAWNVDARTAIPLDVRNTDVLGMRLQVGAGFKFPVRVRIEGHSPGDDAELEKLYFSVRPEVPVAGFDLQAYSPFANGRFILDLLKGDYWVDLTRPDDYYVKSITLDGVDVLNGGLHVTNSVEGPMEIVVDNRFGEVQGRAAASNVTVVLVPDAARRNQRPLYRATKTPNGVFNFQKVPPGDYKLFAWSEETIDNGGPWLDPEYLRKYEDRATPIRVQSGFQTVLDRPIPEFR